MRTGAMRLPVGGGQGVIFDVDGCLVRGKRPIDGAPETVGSLRARGVHVVYITNDSSRTPGEIARGLSAMGFDAQAEEVITSSLVVASYLKERLPRARVLPIGTVGLIQALEEQGLTLVGPELAGEADVLAMGRDPDFGYAKLEAACRAIWGGARFIATNLDPRIPAENGFRPGTGPMVKAVAYATGKRPLVMGKPSRWAGELAIVKLGVPRERVIVVGDQLDQDIGLGKRIGVKTVLVLTGASRKTDVSRVPERLRPDLVLPDVTHLLRPAVAVNS